MPDIAMPDIGRRAVLASAVTLTVAAALRTRPARAQVPGPLTLPALPYGYAANEPHIDAQTMQLHHDKHHAAYVNNLNTAVKDHGRIGEMPLPALLARLNELPESIRAVVRNNAGGHANHSMFWTVMGGQGGVPSGALAVAIERDLGGLPALQTAFNKAGAGVFGSGWVFVSVTGDGRLAVTARPNQDTPLMDGGRVLFGNDVWEHAYYLTYQNRRAEYLTAWWNVLNWPVIERRFAAAQAGTLAV